MFMLIPSLFQGGGGWICLQACRGRGCLLIVLSVFRSASLNRGLFVYLSYKGVGGVRCWEVRCQAVRRVGSLHFFVGSTIVLGGGGGGCVARDTPWVYYILVGHLAQRGNKSPGE